MYSVSVSNLVVTRGRYPALAYADFLLPNHHFTVVTGANGSGKTTLLKAIAGLSTYVKGSITLFMDKQTISDVRALRSVVSFAGHNPTYMRHIRVNEHLKLCEQLDMTRHGEKREINKRDYDLTANELIDRLVLALRNNTRVNDLSAGQQRRLAIASALIRRCALVCVDEPHSSLDVASKELIDELLGEQYRAGRSFIVATHEPQRFDTLATHYLELESGVCRAREVII